MTQSPNMTSERRRTLDSLDTIIPNLRETLAPRGEEEGAASVRCWACAQENRVPTFHGVSVPIIKCTRCHALIEETPLGPLEHATSSSKSGEKNGRPIEHQILGYGMAAAVLSLCTVVAVTAVAVTLPIAANQTALAPLLPLAQLGAIALYASIVFSYLAVLSRHPGPVPPLPVSSSQSQSLERACEDWRWCQPCGAPKNPTAHHCRRCGECVDRLDHHCVWTANRCVGAGNTAPFLRFLKLLLLACGISLGVSVAMGCRRWPEIAHHTLAMWHRPAQHGALLHALTFSLRWLIFAPFELGAWSVSLMLSMSAGIGVAMLLARQLRVLAKGSTVLEEIRRRRRELRETLLPETGQVGGLPPGEVDPSKTKAM